ncbi:MAG: cupin domain-containing protein [bacterium]
MKHLFYLDIPEKEVDEEGAQGVFIRVLIGPDDGADNFTMRRFRVRPGGYTPRHDHDWEHEVYVLSGKGELASAEGPKGIKAGDVIFVPAGETHQFKNASDSDLEFICVIPGQ